MNAKEQFVYDTALVCVQHIRNAMKASEQLGRTVGQHSRFMEKLLYSKHKHEFLLCGQSKESAKSGSTHPEHIVPCLVLLGESKRLIKEGKDNEYIAKLFAKHWKIVHITKDESDLLDSKSKLGLKARMPDGWSFETGDTFARLEAAGIELV